MCTSWRVFFFFLIINGCLILSEAFYLSTDMIIFFLLFNLLMWSITMIDLQILKNPCIPGINPTRSWCTFNMLWIQFANILLRIFASVFISDTGF